MGKKFSVREVADATNALGALLHSKPDIEFATSRMAQIQPERSEFWLQASAAVSKGRPLSEQLSGQWSEDFVHPIRIGEKSAELSRILHKIRDAARYSEGLTKLLFKLVRPMIYITLAVVITLMYVGFLLPALAGMIDDGSASVVGESGGLVHDLLVKAWPLLIGGIVAIGAFAATWLRAPDNRLLVVGWSLHLPYIGPGLGRILFAKWARYMSIMHATGTSKVNLWDMLRLTAPVLPVALRSPLLAAASMLESGSPIARVFTDNSAIYKGVNRKLVPHEIVTAFLIAADTGDLHEQLNFVEVDLDREGKEQLERGIKAIDGAFTIAAFVAMSIPLYLYFSQMLTNLAATGRAL